MSTWQDPNNTTQDNEKNHGIWWSSFGKELNKDCDTNGESYGNSKFTDFLLNANNIRQESSSQSSKNNGMTNLFKKNTQIAEFSVVTPEQSKFIKPVDMAIRSEIQKGDPDVTKNVNEIRRTNQPEQQNNTFLFPRPANPGKREVETPIQTRLLKELLELKVEKRFNPQNDRESQIKLRDRFDWTDTLLTQVEKQAIEDNLVDQHYIFARHRKDIGMNTEFNVKLIPKDDEAVYSQNLPMPIHLKKDLIVELSLIHKYGNLMIIPFSKYASPNFARRNPNGKRRLHVDLTKINSLIADDYTNYNHPVSFFSGKTQHLAGKSLCCKLDCSQACHCLQRADQRSLEMLALIFASRTLAYKRLAKDLSRSISSFSSYLRDYLDAVVKADQSAQNVKDVGIAANNARDPIRKIRAVFSAFCEQNWNWQKKCHFGVQKSNSLDKPFHQNEFHHKFGKFTTF